MPVSVMQRFARGELLFDGGMGTMLIDAGLAVGWPPEEWNVSQPQRVLDVHRQYLRAGAEVIGTNTFGGTPSRLHKHGLAERAAEFNAAGIGIARQAVAAEKTVPCFVAFSMGPSGEMFPPVGGAQEAGLRVAFDSQLGGVDRNDAPDLVLIETMYDLREALIALDAARRALSVPVVVSMTYGRTPRGFHTMMGNPVEDTTRELVKAGVDVIAANCSIASGDMIDLARILRASTDLPVLCQPNAGQPAVRDGRHVYEQSAAEFAADAVQLFSLGINAVGGCCGTSPDFIRLAAAALNS